LIDFDISKENFKRNEEFLMWTNTGSLHYRAPETFSLGYGQKIDIWSVGIILYEVLTGEVPFNSKYER
jgi:serine/threonine protein kinase